MVKISIALPNQTQISLEADDFVQLRPGVDLVRQGLLGELANLATPPNADAVTTAESEKSSGEQTTDAPSPAKRQPRGRAGTPETPSQTTAEAVPNSLAANTAAVPPELSDPRLTRDFTVFCRAADPMGDMRKVVAAAEGARRHLNMDNVDAWELGHLFDLAGWTRPRNFTQTLRNAARNSFRWLERVPGRSGRYTTTEKGRSVALGGTNAS
ncbi:MAG: hypothetical protein BZY88_19330 [SAR202 cluster bacterium Io17-Chloro-G9]|nr:MAG: hypothetical protein BZY88_19330 [SAR202 cluster bacterium Io17-Chloro-G9]